MQLYDKKISTIYNFYQYQYFFVSSKLRTSIINCTASQLISGSSKVNKAAKIFINKWLFL